MSMVSYEDEARACLERALEALEENCLLEARKELDEADRWIVKALGFELD